MEAWAAEWAVPLALSETWCPPSPLPRGPGGWARTGPQQTPARCVLDCPGPGWANCSPDTKPAPHHHPHASCFLNRVLLMCDQARLFLQRQNREVAGPLCRSSANPNRRKIPEAGYSVGRSPTDRRGYQGRGYGVGQAKPRWSQARLCECSLTQVPRLDPQSCPLSLPPAARRSEPTFPVPSATPLARPAAALPPPAPCHPGSPAHRQAQGARWSFPKQNLALPHQQPPQLPTALRAETRSLSTTLLPPAHPSPAPTHERTPTYTPARVLPCQSPHRRFFTLLQGSRLGSSVYSQCCPRRAGPCKQPQQRPCLTPWLHQPLMNLRPRALAQHPPRLPALSRPRVAAHHQRGQHDGWKEPAGLLIHVNSDDYTWLVAAVTDNAAPEPND